VEGEAGKEKGEEGREEGLMALVDEEGVGEVLIEVCEEGGRGGGREGGREGGVDRMVLSTYKWSIRSR